MRSAVAARCNILFLGMLYVSIPPVVYHEYAIGKCWHTILGLVDGRSRGLNSKILAGEAGIVHTRPLAGQIGEQTWGNVFNQIWHDLGPQQVCNKSAIWLRASNFVRVVQRYLGKFSAHTILQGCWELPFFFVRTFLAILRVCLAQSQHTGTIDMPNNGAKPDAGSCHAILACQCQVPPSAPALSAELFVGKHWQLASVLRLAAKRIKREYWEKILFLTWSIDKCQLILQVFPFSFDGSFLSISAKVKCTNQQKPHI